MSIRSNRNFKESSAYDMLLELIVHARDEKHFMDLAELTLMNKTDRLIYRNKLACEGVEMTPIQVDEYLAVVEYALEYTV
jgi:hypothetical protein